MSEKLKLISSKQAIELLTPSGMSAVISVVLSLTLALGVVFINRYRSSSLSLDYSYYQSHSTHAYLGGTLLKNSVVQNLPLIIFWILAGIIVYLIAYDIVEFLKTAIELRKEMNYVHSRPKRLIEEVLTPLIIRLIVLGVWTPYLIVFFNSILPYATKLAIQATTASSTLLVVGYILLSVIITTAAIHINVILLRLIFLKARLFASSIEE